MRLYWQRVVITRRTVGAVLVCVTCMATVSPATTAKESAVSLADVVVFCVVDVVTETSSASATLLLNMVNVSVFAAEAELVGVALT